MVKQVGRYTGYIRIGVRKPLHLACRESDQGVRALAKPRVRHAPRCSEGPSGSRCWPPPVFASWRLTLFDDPVLAWLIEWRIKDWLWNFVIRHSVYVGRNLFRLLGLRRFLIIDQSIRLCFT